MSEVLWTDKQQLEDLVGLITKAVMDGAFIGYSEVTEPKLLKVISDTSMAVTKLYTDFLNREANTISQKGDE